MVTTLKTLVQKTATVNSVKLSTPADRIGQGLVAVATYPAEVLSSGRFPSPHSPGSEANPGGSRQELSAAQMQMHPRAMATAAEPPVGPTGRPVPGSSATRRPWSFTQHLAERWCRVATKRPAATGRVTTAGLPATATTPAAVVCRASFPAAAIVQDRIGDCQSPDRTDDRRAARREATPTAAAGK
jgi:hypothetical protein